jgi:hemoglobin
VKAYLAIACFAFGCGGKPATKTTTTKKVSDRGDMAATDPGGSSTDAPPAKKGELYDRLGGQAALVAVVDEFVARVGSDDRVKLRFLNTDIPRLKSLLVEFVCMATGGPCKYSGQDMQTSHGGMEVTDEEFGAIVEALSGALDKFKVPAKEKGELLGALGPLKPRIVTPKERLKPVSEAMLAKAKAVLPKITDETAKAILQGAITAAARGQRNYADQLFSRVEIMVGATTVAAAAPTFRAGAPKRIDSAITQMDKNAPQQPNIVGTSEEDDAGQTGPASLRGKITVDGKPLDGVGLVMLYPKTGKYKKRTAKQRIMEQRKKTFWPRLLAVPPGSTVAFPNYDPLYHNVFSLSATQPFDIGSYKDGQSRSMKFDKPGMVRLGCNVHAQMAAFIFVIDAPAYVPVEGNTQFNFRVLTPGKYRARVWSEHSKEPKEQEVTIRDGVNEVTFDVKGDADKGPSTDKFGNSRALETK